MEQQFTGQQSQSNVTMSKGSAEKLRNNYSKWVDLVNIGGGIAIECFVPELSNAVPAFQKIYKNSQMSMYDYKTNNQSSQSQEEPITKEDLEAVKNSFVSLIQKIRTDTSGQ